MVLSLLTSRGHLTNPSIFQGYGAINFLQPGNLYKFALVSPSLIYEELLCSWAYCQNHNYYGLIRSLGDAVVASVS